jgi:uncharacterized protein YjbI with pentapeptide repeats
MEIYRPLQLGFSHQVLEQDRKFFFVASATLGIKLDTGEALLDLYYLKDVFASMGENILPDMGMPKPNAEFLVSGCFFARNGQPVTGGEVKVTLGRKEKKLCVFGPRRWQAGFPCAPEEINAMSVDYSNAFGGSGYKKNPEGIGYKDGLLPCIEDPDRLVASQNDRPDPAGFGPVPPMRQQRMQYQGTYRSDYREKYFPGYPADFDWKYFLCAPSDQWTPQYFTGNESFAIHHMHPDIPLIQGNLPGLHARCFLGQNKKGETEFGELPLKLDTVWFFPEKLTTLLIFRGVLEIADDEAQTITHVLAAYEDLVAQPRSPEYYRKAFEKRKNSGDGFLKNLNTRDLIPQGHRCAMEILMDEAFEDDSDNELSNNIDAKADAIRRIADEKMEQAIQETENSIENIGISDDAWTMLSDDAKAHIPGKKGGLDIRKLVKKTSDTPPDTDTALFMNQLETAIPGISAGDPRKLDMKNFSFDKIDEVMAAAEALAEKKETYVKTAVKREVEKGRKKIVQQLQDIEKQIENNKKAAVAGAKEQLNDLEESKTAIAKSLEALENINLDSSLIPKSPLPRIDADEIGQQLQSTLVQFDPLLMDAMQHLHAMKKTGAGENVTTRMAQTIQEKIKTDQKQLDDAMAQARDAVKDAEKSFKESYIMAAHFMDQGLSPHKQSLTDLKSQFLKAVSNNENVSCGDWACIDLEGENLDGIDLSGAYLEQANFKGASLKGANLSYAIMSRAVLEDADLSGATLKGANIGAANARRAVFNRSDLGLARLSKGDFTGADFSNANLEEIETLEIQISGADFTNACMPKVIFLETIFSDAVFVNTDLRASAFMKSCIKACDFSKAILKRSIFVDTAIADCRFTAANLSHACFTVTEHEDVLMENLVFRSACLKQSNFQGLDLKHADFSCADMENAFFGSADLSEANLCHALAKNTQFRKAVLIGAKLDNINLDQGSLAKADLAGASFVGANLHGVDFLRANLFQTDFTAANLDMSLLEHWRPKQ